MCRDSALPSEGNEGHSQNYALKAQTNYLHLHTQPGGIISKVKEKMAWLRDEEIMHASSNTTVLLLILVAGIRTV